jgi:hypothetical protein
MLVKKRHGSLNAFQYILLEKLRSTYLTTAVQCTRLNHLDLLSPLTVVPRPWPRSEPFTALRDARHTW